MSEIDRCKRDIEDIREQLRREHDKMLEDKRSRYVAYAVPALTAAGLRLSLHSKK